MPFWLGEISYGIFAIHMIVLNLVFRALDLEVFTGRFLTVALLTLAITMVLATAVVLPVREADPAAQERPVLRTDGTAGPGSEPQPTPEIAP